MFIKFHPLLLICFTVSLISLSKNVSNFSIITAHRIIIKIILCSVDFGSDHQKAIKSGMMYLEDKTFKVILYKNCLKLMF